MVADRTPTAAQPVPAAEPEVAPWVAPALLLSILMLGFDLVALIPLGEWMAEYGIGLVCTAYLLHVLASTALAVWTVIRLPLLHLDTDHGSGERFEN
ncbi:hypothetical protein [Nocardia rhizosphaerae]|uniref:Uncharacterized protein n=1 Tax=Nocardia rhizosphaerae TaxID=1691571 RepID=A0ABV8LB74_9NOCA